jgi:hypothetical protein
MICAKTLATTLAAAIASLTLFSGAAFADQQPESWLSGTGSGTFCTRDTPCKFLDFAYATTMAGGAISVVDGGNFGSSGVAIAKSLTIRAVGSVAGAMSIDGIGAWITVNLASSDTVVLDGLSFLGAGINIVGAGTVVIRNCRIGFNNRVESSNDLVFGIRIAPTGPLQVVVSDTAVENNGNASGGAGIHVVPQPGGSARVMLERVTVSRNQFGVAVDGSQSTAGINHTIKDSTLSANVNDGVVAVTSSGHAPVGVFVSNTSSTNNTYGIRSIGPNVTVRVDNSKVVGNGTGLVAGGGGALLTYGNNKVDANGADGAFTGSVAVK